MTDKDPGIEGLLGKAASGDQDAIQQLFETHRARLKRMVAIRLDARVAARIDPSDVVQDALGDAALKLGDYLRQRPLPFYPWLHRLTTERIAQAHRRHVKARSRAVERERAGSFPLPDESAMLLVDRLVGSGTSPSQRLLKKERQQQVSEAMAKLGPNDREVLVLCYLDGLTFGEIGAILGITENASKVRHFRALERIRKLMETIDSGEASE